MIPGSATGRTGVAVLVTAVALLMAAPQPAHAKCDDPLAISTFYSASVRSYLDTPGTCPTFGSCSFPYYSSVTGYVQGDFWALGHGNKTDTNAGIDNGTFPVDGYTGYYISPYSGWITTAAFFYPAAIDTDWAADAGINGCPDTITGTRCMGVLVSDATGLGPGGLPHKGYFAFMTDEADALGNYNFGLPGGADLDLGEIPRPSVTGSRHVGLGRVEIDLAPVTLTDGLYLDPACPTDVVGYRVYHHVRPHATAPPGARRRTDFELTDGGAGPSGEPLPLGSPVTVTLPSCSSWQNAVLVYSLVFDDGFETDYVGANSANIYICEHCTNADGDDFCRGYGDCDDTDPDIYPGAVEVCDGVDNNCDGTVDEGPGQDSDADTVPDSCDNCPLAPNPTQLDFDQDSFGDACDCDGTNEQVFPGAPQLCDGINNDCSDAAWPSLPPAEADADGDTFALCEGDCDDSAVGVYPGAPPLCDGLNNDCNDPQWPAVPPDELDVDLDGYGICAGDCNDGDAAINPGATESCNQVDDDCNSLIDEDELGEDTDGDGVHNLCDNCRDVINPGQGDTDGDLVGNSCDNCLFDPNAGQADFDADLRGDICDNCPNDFNTLQDDFDFDGYGDVCDNCPFDPHPSQSDTDDDFEGDWCDFDDGLIYVYFATADMVEWQDEVGFDAWNAYRGDLGVLVAEGVYTQDLLLHALAAQQCDLDDPWWQDPDPVPVGKTVFYLTAGLANNVEGSLDDDGSGSDRANDNPCP